MSRDTMNSVDAASPPDAFGAAPEVAALGALFEIGDRLGVLPFLERGDAVDAGTLAALVDLPVTSVESLLQAYEAAAIVERASDDEKSFRAVAGFAWLRYQAGYVSWAMNANRPFIENAREFLQNPGKARESHVRDGRQVAVSSQWMGSKAFYPALLSTLMEARPARIVDLGAGTAGLLIEVLSALRGATGVALDLAPEACAAARQAAELAGVADRLTVVRAPIQSLAGDAALLRGADAITAGFVFHDMMPEEECVADAVLRRCRDALPRSGMLAITEAVPYAPGGWERRFSALVTYFHQQFMGRRLLSEREWHEKLRSAGFTDIACIRQPFPTGRLFVARP